jgi:signal transduction histidine kinase
MSSNREKKTVRKVDQFRLFESFLADISTTFASLPYERVDAEILDALQGTAELLRMDRVAIFELRPDAFEVVHGYARPGIVTQVGLDLNQFKWYVSKLQLGEAVVLMNVAEDLPKEAKAEREYCKSVGMKSLATMPIRVAGLQWGAITTASFRGIQRLSKELQERLKLIGEILANAFVRKRMEEQRRLAELEAQRNREELIHIGRISAAGELVASIAHELNQPLTAILSNAQAGLRSLSTVESSNSKEIQEILKEIIEDNTRAVEVIRKLRALMNKGTSEFNDLNVNIVINDVCMLLKSDAILRNALISMELSDDLPLVYVDRIQIQQVLLNLMLNAIESIQNFSADRRKVTIRTIRIDDRVRISVHDCGKGINQEEHNKIFDPFFTTKPEGMGMGLSIARSIVKAHSGALWFENNSGYGSTFHFTIPATKNRRSQDA